MPHETCHVKCSLVTILQALVTASRDRDTRRRTTPDINKPPQQEWRLQLFKHTRTSDHVGLTDLLSRCTWGCPFARTARSRTMQGPTTMPHHPHEPIGIGVIWDIARLASNRVQCPTPDQRCDPEWLSKALQFTPHAEHKPRRINTTKQSTRSTHHCSGSVRKATVTTEVPHDGFVKCRRQERDLLCQMLHCAPSYKHWHRQAVTPTPANNTSQKQADTTKATPSTFQLFKHTNTTKGLL